MKYLSLIISVLFYLIGVGGLFYMIFWTGDLLPFHKMHYGTDYPVIVSLMKNFSLIVLFGLQHSIMARQSFKLQWTKLIPKHLERSIYVLVSGLLCILIAWQWAPIGGVLWEVQQGSLLYYLFYGIFFFGILFLLSSTFLINHFELFGLQQAYHNVKGKIAAAQSFKEILYYKLVRHPIYLGFFMIVWSTPNMTYTHLCLALMLTAYTFVGIALEEKDLVRNFGDTYRNYKKRVPSVIPFSKL